MKVIDDVILAVISDVITTVFPPKSPTEEIMGGLMDGWTHSAPTSTAVVDVFAQPLPTKLFQHLKRMPLNLELLSLPESEHLMTELLNGTITVEDMVQQIQNTTLQQWRDICLNVLKLKILAPPGLLRSAHPKQQVALSHSAVSTVDCQHGSSHLPGSLQNDTLQPQQAVQDVKFSPSMFSHSETLKSEMDKDAEEAKKESSENSCGKVKSFKSGREVLEVPIANEEQGQDRKTLQVEQTKVENHATQPFLCSSSDSELRKKSELELVNFGFDVIEDQLFISCDSYEDLEKLNDVDKCVDFGHILQNIEAVYAPSAGESKKEPIDRRVEGEGEITIPASGSKNIPNIGLDQVKRDLRRDLDDHFMVLPITSENPYVRKWGCDLISQEPKKNEKRQKVNLNWSGTCSKVESPAASPVPPRNDLDMDFTMQNLIADMEDVMGVSALQIEDVTDNTSRKTSQEQQRTEYTVTDASRKTSQEKPGSESSMSGAEVVIWPPPSDSPVIPDSPVPPSPSPAPVSKLKRSDSTELEAALSRGGFSYISNQQFSAVQLQQNVNHQHNVNQQRDLDNHLPITGERIPAKKMKDQVMVGKLDSRRLEDSDTHVTAKATEGGVLASGHIKQKTEEEQQKKYKKRGRSESSGVLSVPELSAYEQVRNENIADREAALENLLREINQLKKNIIGNSEPPKKRQRRVKKVLNSDEARRSKRITKPVNYQKFYDNGWKKGKQKKKVERFVMDRKHSPLEDPEWKPKTKQGTYQDQPADINAISGTARCKRTIPKANYIYDYPRNDDYIFCDDCDEPQLHGCSVHPLIWDFKANFTISLSRAGKDAGRGVFNNGCDVPKNAIFGPYSGNHISVAEYNLQITSNAESGYAWEIKDPDTDRVSGYCDPGPNPDPTIDWMHFVNCAPKIRNQNLIAVQYRGQIYYKSVCVIPEGVEALVYYGNEYAKAINIDVAKLDLYEKRENWKSKGALCKLCGQYFASDEILKNHVEANTAAGRNGGCKVLRQNLNQKEVETGEKPCVCDVCGMGFKKNGDLKIHLTKHSNVREFDCPHCNLAYKTSKVLQLHIKRIHLGERFCCPVCDRPFADKGNMKRHWRNKCSTEPRPENPLKCDECGLTFGASHQLKQHKSVVHLRQFLYACDTCDKRFGTKNTLKLHVNSKHETTELFKCSTCPATFKTSSNRISHQRIYHEPKQWKCDFCAEMGVIQLYGQRYQLKKHLDLCHPPKTPFVCNKCGKKFSTENEVDSHRIKMHI